VLLKVGITGGIGSGKTTVCKVFEVLGVCVYYADKRAHELIEQHPEIIKAYKKLFGFQAYINGHLNRTLVAQKIFSDTSLLNKVNSVVHPLVREDFGRWLQNKYEPFVLKEAAVLFESGEQNNLDKIILVSAPENLRISRVVERDATNRDMVLKRISNQWTDEQRRPLCDYEIVANDENLIVPQVIRIYIELMKRA
jgi:dephospho-CoA kinase